MVSHLIRLGNHCDVTIPLSGQQIKLHNRDPYSLDGQTRNEPGKADVAFYCPVLPLKAFHCTNHPGSRYNSQYKKIHKKFGSHNGFLTQSMHQCISAKTQNQIDHCDETKKEYSWLIPYCKPELKETTS